MTTNEFESLQMQHGNIVDFTFLNDCWHFEFEDHFCFDDPEEENLKQKKQIEWHQAKKWRCSDD